jgi:hypothetical protein
MRENEYSTPIQVTTVQDLARIHTDSQHFPTQRPRFYRRKGKVLFLTGLLAGQYLIVGRNKNAPTIFNIRPDLVLREAPL